jgi:hypothetical protein
MLIHDADITGSFLYNGINISNVTGSAASLTALNQFSASINLFTGSYNTGSFTGSFIGNGSGLNGVVSASFATNARSASFALTATSASQATNSNTAISASFASTATSASFALVSTSGSYAATSSFASSFTVANTLTATTLVVNTISSSVVFSSGSNIFGNALSNTQVFTGSLQVTGSTHYLLGSVGIGTTSPAAELQVAKASDVTIAMSNSNSVTSGNRGGIAWYNSNVSTVANIRAVAITDNVGTQLEFYTRPAAGSLTQVFTLASTGAATFTGNITVDKSSPNISINAPSGTSGQYNINNGVGTLMWAMYSTTGGSNAQGNWQLYSAGKTGGAGNVIDITPAGAATFSSSVTAGNAILNESSYLLKLGNSSSTNNASIGFFNNGGQNLEVLYAASGKTTFHHGVNVSANAFYIGRDNTYDLVVNSSGNVGIGTTAPATKLEVFGTGNTLRLDSAVNGAKTILLRNVGTATAEIKTDGNLDFNIEDANRTMRFLTSNTERMRITSDGYARLSTNSLGIQFNGDTAAANALDDYEEGTFTPGLTFGGSSTGMTFFDRAGVYTKIGRQVSCTIYLALTAKGSSTGEAILTGLPFTNGNYNRGSQSPASIRFDSITYTGTLQPYLANSSSGIRFQYVTEAGSDTTVTNSNFTDGAEMSITVTYFV